MANEAAVARGAPDRDVDWVGAGAAIASISAVGTALGLGLPLLSVVLQQRGISATMIGANTAVAGVASIAAAPLAPVLARRFGVRLLMLVSVLVAAIAALGFHYLTPFWTWFPLRVAFHGAITTLFIMSEFWITAVTPLHRRGFILGIYATCLSLGFALGPWIFAQVGSAGVLPFAIGGGVLLASALPLVLAWNRAPEVGGREHAAPLWRYILLVPTATAAVFVFGAVESGGFALFPIFGGRIGFDEGAAAQLLTAIGLGNVALQIPIGLVSDRVSDRRILLLVCACVGLAGSLCLPLLTASWWLMAMVLFLWGGVVAGLYTVGLAHLGSRLPPVELAGANAAFIFCYSLGMLAGPQSIGLSMDAIGTNGFAFSIAAFFAAYLVLTATRLAAGRHS